MNDQAGCFENMRDFPSDEIPFGYRLRSPLLIGEIASSLRSSQRPLSLPHGFLNHPEYGDVPQSTILFILEIGYLYQYLFLIKSMNKGWLGRKRPPLF